MILRLPSAPPQRSTLRSVRTAVLTCSAFVLTGHLLAQAAPDEPAAATPAITTPELTAATADPQVSSSSLEELPDAPQPTFAVAALETPADLTPEPVGFQFRPVDLGGINPFARAVNVQQCPNEPLRAHDPACKVHWGQFAIEGSLYLAFQNGGNIYTGYFYREATLTGKWWDRYVNSVEGWRWTRWTDQNPFLDDYIGHPMQGAITNAIWIQNDPRGMTVVQANDWAYYRSRLRALAFSTFFSFEWKLGPIGEASIGHNGDHYFPEKGELTNETGWVELVTTPVGGILWTMGEDYLDRKLIPKLEHHSHNALYLMGVSFLTPTRTTANILRFRAPWYRDGRVVKSDSFFSDPPDDIESSPDAIIVGNHEGDAIPPSPSVSSTSLISEPAPVPAAPVVSIARPRLARNVPYIGGVHEFGVIWGMSLFSQGPAGDVKYMPIVVRYSYLLHQGEGWGLRYAPELTALSMVDFPSPIPADLEMAMTLQRTRTYGAGLSPVGFQLDFRTSHRWQPFLSTNEGVNYYDAPVLIPNTGPNLLYTADIGGGVNIFRKRRQALTLGYRYQRLAGFPGSVAGASTEANTFYVGVSRFRSRESADDRPHVF